MRNMKNLKWLTLATLIIGSFAAPSFAEESSFEAIYKKLKKSFSKLEANKDGDGCAGCYYVAGLEVKNGAERFSDLLGRIKDALKNLDPNDNGALDRLRADLYYLQAIFRLYMNAGSGNKADPFANYAAELAPLNAKVKSLEDSIGGYMETLRLGNDGNAALKNIKSKLKAEGWLADDGNIPAIENIDKVLKGLKFQDPETERNMLLERVATQLDYVQNAHYDMHEVEEGVHALRKEMRWYRYYVAALTTRDSNNSPVPLLATTSDHCPMNGGVEPKAEAFKAGYTCNVSACLPEEYLKLERVMSGLKKRGADAMNAGAKVGDDIVKQATEIMKKLHETGIPGNISKQVRACKK